MTITHCPTCGSRKLGKVRGFAGEVQGQRYTVPDLEFHECANCGERVYDPQAMRKIEASSPAFARPHLAHR